MMEGGDAGASTRSRMRSVAAVAGMNESSAQALVSANRHEGRKDGAEDEDDDCARAANDDDGSDRCVSSRARTSTLFFPRLPPSTPSAFFQCHGTVWDRLEIGMRPCHVTIPATNTRVKRL